MCVIVLIDVIFRFHSKRPAFCLCIVERHEAATVYMNIMCMGVVGGVSWWRTKIHSYVGEAARGEKPKDASTKPTSIKARRFVF